MSQDFDENIREIEQLLARDKPGVEWTVNPGKRKRIADFLPDIAFRENFLTEVEGAALEYSHALARRKQNPQDRKSTKKNLERLSKAAKDFLRAFVKLDDVARAELDRCITSVLVDGSNEPLKSIGASASENDAFWYMPALRSVSAIGKTSAKCAKALPRRTRSIDEDTHKCIQKLALALWKYSGAKPGRRNYWLAGDYDRSDLADLCDRVMSPVRARHGMTETTFTGVVRTVIDGLPDELPGGFRLPLLAPDPPKRLGRKPSQDMDD